MSDPETPHAQEEARPLGTSMRYRLQGVLPAAEPQINAFDLAFWHQATALAFFGVELYVHSGAVTLSLRHATPDGQEVEIASLVCPFPGSQFSPPLELAQLAQAGGVLRPVIVTQSDDAVFDAYFGTNDPAPLPTARPVFHTLPAGPEGAKQPSLRQICHQLAYGMVQSAPAAAADPTATLDVPTHLVMLPRAASDPALAAECQTRSRAFACFQHPNTVLHRTANLAQPWPLALLDLRQIYLHGLPGGELETYMGQLDRQGVARTAPQGALPPVPPPGKKSLFQRLRTAFPRPPAPEIIRIRLEQAEQARRTVAQLTQTRQQLEGHLRHNRLWETAPVLADLSRASQTALTLLRNRHKGQRAVVIGNGPSLQIPDLERLRDTVTFASNKIYLAYEDTDWRPTYYSVEDHLVLLNNRDRIEALKRQYQAVSCEYARFRLSRGRYDLCAVSAARLIRRSAGGPGFSRLQPRSEPGPRLGVHHCLQPDPDGRLYGLY